MKISRSENRIPNFAYGLVGFGVYFTSIGVVMWTTMFNTEPWGQLPFSFKATILLGNLWLVALIIAEIIFWSRYFFGNQDAATESRFIKMWLGVIVSFSLVYLIGVSWEIIAEGLMMPFK